MKIVDINSDQYDFFKPSAGDRFQVEQIIEKYNNRVIVNGAVYRPGTYSVTDGMTIKNLIDKAEGLKTDVFFDKVTNNVILKDTSEEDKDNWILMASIIAILSLLAILFKFYH